MILTLSLVGNLDPVSEWAQNIWYVVMDHWWCWWMVLTASLNGDLRWKKRSSKLHNFDHFCTVQSHLCSILRFLTCAPSSHLWRFMGSQFSPSMATVRNFKMHFRTQPSKGKLFRMLPLTHWQTDWGSSDLLSSPTMLVKLSMEAVHNISYYQ